MNKSDIRKLIKVEERSREITEEFGCKTTEVDFRVVSSRRMIEAMAYHFPVNFSHWTFGRDFDRERTRYEYSGQGIPYEQVWNFDKPTAFLVETNPVGLNALVIAHVFFHVDFFLANKYLQRGRSFSDLAEEARYAAARFKEYESLYGADAVESIMDAGLCIQWQQPRDIFLEEPTNEQARAYLVRQEKDRINYIQKNYRAIGQEKARKELHAAREKIKRLSYKNPPEPVYDLLKYLIEHAPLDNWQKDILTVIRNQARALAPNMMTKMIDEGWAVTGHMHIMRQLFREGITTAAENDTYQIYHAKVTQPSRLSLNVYNVGTAIFEYVKERWDRGQFGEEYEECTDPKERANWNTGAQKGHEKMLEVREKYTDRRAVEEFFTPEFIHDHKLYMYDAEKDPSTGDIYYTIREKRPEIIRRIFSRSFALYDKPQISIVNDNYNNNGKLYLRHDYYGAELDPRHLHGVLRNIQRIWRRPVMLETIREGKQLVCVFNGKKYYEKEY